MKHALRKMSQMNWGILYDETALNPGLTNYIKIKA